LIVCSKNTGSLIGRSSQAYPHLDRIVLYEQQIETMTGKRSEGLYH